MRLNSLKFVVVIVFFVSFILSCKTQAPKATVQPTVRVEDTTPLAKSLFWEIKGKNLPKPSYLFGTIHIIDKADFYLPPILTEKLKQCDNVAFEIDLAEMNNLSALFTLLKEAMMKEGIKLRDLVSTEEYTLIKNYFQKIGLPMVMLERVKPMFLSMLATGDGSISDFSHGNMMSYEMEIYDLAKRHQKSTGGLETIEYQVSLFDSIPYADQAKMLVNSIQNSSMGTSELDSTTLLYREQDIEAMVSLVGADEGLGKYEQILLINRNQNWVPQMSKMMQKAPVFFAVGAGHLGGKHGVIRLLMKAGYEVNPIAFKFGDIPKTIKL